jgi:hypothetical protein
MKVAALSAGIDHANVATEMVAKILAKKAETSTEMWAKILAKKAEIAETDTGSEDSEGCFINEGCPVPVPVSD